MLIKSTRTHFSVALVAALISFACSNSAVHAEKQKLRQSLQEAGTSTAALSYARYLLNHSADTTDGIEKEWAEIQAMQKKYEEPEFDGIAGAYRAQMGDVYQDVDVIQAVTCVDEGLDIMEKSLKRLPTEKTVRMYYGITLASLPALFKKQAEAKSILGDLLATYPLNASERATVEQALQQIR